MLLTGNGWIVQSESHGKYLIAEYHDEIDVNRLGVEGDGREKIQSTYYLVHPFGESMFDAWDRNKFNLVQEVIDSGYIAWVAPDEESPVLGPILLEAFQSYEDAMQGKDRVLDLPTNGSIFNGHRSEVLTLHE